MRRDTSGDQLGRGTKIKLYLKEDQLEFLEERRLKDLVKKHSEFINYPISIWKETTTEKEVDDDDDEPEKDESKPEGDEPKIEEVRHLFLMLILLNFPFTHIHHLTLCSSKLIFLL